jgi:hypothetical protein
MAALDNPAGGNAILELGGPEALSTREVICPCEQLDGRPVTLDCVTEEEFKARLTTCSDPPQQSFAALKLRLAYGDEIEMRDTLRQFPTHLGSMRDYLGRLYMGPAPEHVHGPAWRPQPLAPSLWTLNTSSPKDQASSMGTATPLMK